MVLSTGLIIRIGHRKELQELTFRALALPRSESICYGLTLETSAFESLYGGQFTSSTQLINKIILLYYSPTQHLSFFNNLLPLFSQSVSQTGSQSVRPSVRPSVSPSVSRSVNRSVSRSASRSVSQSAGRSASRSDIQSVVSQSVGQPANE